LQPNPPIFLGFSNSRPQGAGGAADPLSDSDEWTSASGRGLAGEILDLYTGGAFTFWRWTPTTDSLVTHGSLMGESLKDWMMRIHPRDQAAFSQFLDQDWQQAPSFVSIDYRFNANRHGDWIRVRHTGGLSGIGGQTAVSGLVEIISPPTRSRTLLERMEGEMIEAESRLQDFLNGAFAMSGASDPEPLLELLRKTLRAETVTLVNLDSRLDITGMVTPGGGGSAFRIGDLGGPLRKALSSLNGDSSPEVFELDLDATRAEYPWVTAKTVVMPNGNVAAVLCAGFRTTRGRSGARRFHSTLSLASTLTASRICRQQEASHRRDLLAQLRQAQRLSSIGRLTGGFAHDLNNLLTVVQGHLHLLDKAFACRDWEAAVEPLAQIRQSSEQAADFSERLLLFGARRPLEPKVCDLNRLVERFVTMMRRVLEENIEIRLDLDSSIASVRADESMLRDVLMNLLVNARDAMIAGGMVTIRTSSVTRNFAGEGGAPLPFVCLSVSDNGSSTHSDHLPALLESLDLQEIDTKGSGLGLYHVASIIAEHGGRVEPCGDPTKTNQLLLLFPANTAKPETRATNPSSRPAAENLVEAHLRGNTILLVEDETAVRKLVRKLLEVLGCTVIEAVSGREALDLWPEIRDRVSLVVSDIVMPDGVSGWDLARELHHRHPDLGILLTSGYGDLPQDHGLGGIPRIGFLQKPYGVNTLREQLSALTSAVLVS
jgi:signal transduction histidine kinase/ActR/RegA family two-component response regulator